MCVSVYVVVAVVASLANSKCNKRQVCAVLDARSNCSCCSPRVLAESDGQKVGGREGKVADRKCRGSEEEGNRMLARHITSRHAAYEHFEQEEAEQQSRRKPQQAIERCEQAGQSAVKNNYSIKKLK